MRIAGSVSVVLLGGLLACRADGAAPAVRVPARIDGNAALSATLVVGASANIGVTVRDVGNAPVSGVLVSFTVSRGGGRVTPSADTTDAYGSTSATFTIGATPGANEVTAIVNGLPALAFRITGAIGTTRRVTLSPRFIRLGMGDDSLVVTGLPRDDFGNATGDTVVWTSRDPSLIGANARTAGSAMVSVRRRPGGTYLVGAVGEAVDSVLVAVHDAASSPCASLAVPSTLEVGGSLPFDAGLACIRSPVAGAEFAIVAHYNTVVADVVATVEVVATGITSPASAFPYEAGLRGGVAVLPSRAPDEVFERALRLRESRELRSRVAAARDWYRERPSGAVGMDAGVAHANAVGVHVGEVVSLNVNASDFCSNPALVGARVVAITTGTVVLADTANPPDGFTADEYRAFGLALDTLVSPVETAAFGPPTDIDGNGRVNILFTRAVNALSAPSAAAIVLGYYYARDLLPRRGALGTCAGSNEGEMFYLLVPDPNGAINSNPRTKSFVQGMAVSAIAHEYQHLINASRRMYITAAPRVDEEIWLNEGLSHVAEELVFYRAAGRSPRGNIGGGLLATGEPLRTFFDLYQRGNLARYRELLRSPELNSPLAPDDRLATRGGAWSFLRYLADRIGPDDGDFWRRLVNSKFTGVVNLDAAMAGTGTTALAALRAWSISLVADDNPSGTDVTFQQASWNFLSGLPMVFPNFGLTPRILVNGTSATPTLLGGGSAYLRFGVSENQEALVRVNGTGARPLPTAMSLTIVRIK